MLSPEAVRMSLVWAAVWAMLISEGSAELAQLLTGWSMQESWPHPSPGQCGRASWPPGHKSGRDGPASCQLQCLGLPIPLLLTLKLAPVKCVWESYPQPLHLGSMGELVLVVWV